MKSQASVSITHSKISWKICVCSFVLILFFFSCCYCVTVCWLIRAHCKNCCRQQQQQKTTTITVTRCKAVNWIEWRSKLRPITPVCVCVRMCVCERILTKKRVNKWDAKQNEFLQTLSLMMTMMSRPGWRPLFFQLCSIIDTVIRQLTERLTKRCHARASRSASCPLPFFAAIEKVKSLSQREMHTRSQGIRFLKPPARPRPCTRVAIALN